MNNKSLGLMFLMALASMMVGCGHQNGIGDSTRAQVRFVTTEGDITVELFDETPLHRDNFLKQVEAGFYDSLLFHRVIKDFMIQGGDITSKHAAPGQFVGNEEYEPTVKAEFCYPQLYHKRGALCAAREGEDVNPNRESSAYQFYIVCGRTFPTDSLLDRQDSIMYARNGVHMDKQLREYYRTNPGTPHLDGGYTVFGEVVEGMDVVDRIQLSETDTNDRPLKDVRILSAKILK